MLVMRASLLRSTHQHPLQQQQQQQQERRRLLVRSLHVSSLVMMYIVVGLALFVQLNTALSLRGVQAQAQRAGAAAATHIDTPVTATDEPGTADADADDAAAAATVAAAKAAAAAAAAADVHTGVRGRKIRTKYQTVDGGGNPDWDNPPPFPSTLGEIDMNTNEWHGDRPHNELFFWPYDCPTSERACCKSYLGEVCGGEERGVCTDITTSDEVCMRQETGQFWITDFFDSVCVCNGNYWGAACEYCKLGWQGDNCTERSDLIERRDFATLSDVDKQYTIDAFRLAKLTPHPYQPNVSVYDWWAVLHHWSLPDGIIAGDRDILDTVQEGHGGNGAITYHRGLMCGMERALQYVTGNSSYAIPYWNWTHSYGNDNDEVLRWFGGDGDTNSMGDGLNEFCRQSAPANNWMTECDCEVTRGPFADWPLVGDWGYPLNNTIERGFGCQSPWAPSLPSQDTSDCAVTTTLYCADDSEDYGQNMFSKLMGGGSQCDLAFTWPVGLKSADMHARAHRWLGGSLIGHHPASDPLFWMLHSYADLVLEQWIRNTYAMGQFSILNNSWSATIGPPGHTRYECQGPFFPLQQQVYWFEDSRERGFTFDFFEDDLSYDGTERPMWSENSYVLSTPTCADIDASSYVGADELAEAPTDPRFFVPLECAKLGDSCCPSYAGEECGGSLRGTCTDVTSDDTVCDVTNHADSLWWFSDYFTSACVCNTGFEGADCGSCARGYTGEYCNETNDEVRTRRDFASLSFSEMDAVTDAFRLAAVAQSSYQPAVTVMEYFASMVYWLQDGNTVADSSVTDSKTYSYSRSGNMAWHRTALLRLEDELARITGNDTFALPYWNWAESFLNDNDPVMRFFGGDGPPHDEDDSEIYCHNAARDGYGGCNCSVSRVPYTDKATLSGNFGASIGYVQRALACLGKVAASLPTADLIEYAAEIETYYDSDSSVESFARTMTGTEYESGLRAWPHGEFGGMMARVQNWIGGTMTTPELQKYRITRSSPGSDPMYWLAWSYSDLVLERWMRRANYNGWTSAKMSLPTTGAGAGLNRHECMPAHFPLTTNSQALRVSTKFYYTYDFFDDNPDDDEL